MPIDIEDPGADAAELSAALRTLIGIFSDPSDSEHLSGFFFIEGSGGHDFQVHAGSPLNPGDQGRFLELFGSDGAGNTNGESGYGGPVVVSGGAAGDVTGNGNAANGGYVQITPGPGGDNLDGTGNGGNGGDIQLDLTSATGGAGHGGGTNGRNGLVIINGIPTSDPLVEGALWNSGGTIMISAGPP